MYDDILNISLDEIVGADSDDDEIKNERIDEIKRYEKLYLLKAQPDYEVDLTDIPDEKRLSLYEGVIFSGFKRYYKENLTERDYRLESTTPYQIVIGTTVLEDGAWGDMICKVVSYLLDQYPERRADIESFRCPWTKTAMFSTTKKTNFKYLDADLYVNCNHTALHSCWFIQDIMDYIGIEKSEVKMLIHRPCIAEPQELKQHIEREFKRGFKKYIIVQYEKPDDYAEKVIKNIEKYLNPMLDNISKSYPNFFLFDDVTIASGYIKKVKEIIEGNLKYDDKTKKVLYKYLKYLLNYYKL